MTAKHLWSDLNLQSPIQTLVNWEIPAEKQPNAAVILVTLSHWFKRGNKILTIKGINFLSTLFGGISVTTYISSNITSVSQESKIEEQNK